MAYFLYNKQNNTWVFGNRKLFLVLNRISDSFLLAQVKHRQVKPLIINKYTRRLGRRKIQCLKSRVSSNFFFLFLSQPTAITNGRCSLSVLLYVILIYYLK